MQGYVRIDLFDDVKFGPLTRDGTEASLKAHRNAQLPLPGPPEQWIELLA